MPLHVFVAMPFGRKQEIDFDAVYADYLRPALESAGFEVFRADEELRAGDIRTDMFQELLLADLVVVDLTIDNPNVWAERTRLPDKDQWTHYYAGGNEYHQPDHPLLSKDLAQANAGKPVVMRRGSPCRAQQVTEERLNGVGENEPKASDHVLL